LGSLISIDDGPFINVSENPAGGKHLDLDLMNVPEVVNMFKEMHDVLKGRTAFPEKWVKR
jgi:hypothetical protein